MTTPNQTNKNTKTSMILIYSLIIFCGGIALLMINYSPNRSKQWDPDNVIHAMYNGKIKGLEYLKDKGFEGKFFLELPVKIKKELVNKLKEKNRTDEAREFKEAKTVIVMITQNDFKPLSDICFHYYPIDKDAEEGWYARDISIGGVIGTNKSVAYLLTQKYTANISSKK